MKQLEKDIRESGPQQVKGFFQQKTKLAVKKAENAFLHLRKAQISHSGKKPKVPLIISDKYSVVNSSALLMEKEPMVYSSYWLECLGLLLSKNNLLEGFLPPTYFRLFDWREIAFNYLEEHNKKIIRRAFNFSEGPVISPGVSPRLFKVGFGNQKKVISQEVFNPYLSSRIASSAHQEKLHIFCEYEASFFQENLPKKIESTLNDLVTFVWSVRSDIRSTKIENPSTVNQNPFIENLDLDSIHQQMVAISKNRWIQPWERKLRGQKEVPKKWMKRSMNWNEIKRSYSL